MIEMHEWLPKMMASDVMIGKTLTLNPNDALALAAAEFLHEQVSGASVVDSQGKCVGVL